MGTGLIFAAIVAAWLAYLVPLFLRRNQVDLDADDPADHFSSSVRIVTSGTAPLVDQDGEEISDVEVSTPMTRRSAIRRIRGLERQAASRRRRVLVVLMVGLTLCLAAAALELLPWWSLAVPGGLLLVFLAVARITVRRMVRRHDQLVARIRVGSEEETVLITVGAGVVAGAEGQGTGEPSRPLRGLWDPIPVTTPTYVSKPLAPRTVRTIDLSAPDVTSSGRRTQPVLAETGPVTAAPTPEVVPEPVVEVEDRRRAVGE
ncbi:hypothetical protein DT076_05340 [Desertihabitans brevis]|uniref:Uncharacterized protein n=1 Tax=Desertihabitans brevis TaxID=2268447 RepID=A0A367Z0T4_9ACTN|nr:hypothetical protein [Desertihabitans brevis]RCK70811.1 hypothetical protein DT076_05340 [Desertihabitans brevis]